MLYKYNYKYTTITINYINTTSCYKFTWVNPEKMLVHIYYQKASNGFVPLLDYSLNRLKPLSFYGGNLFMVTWGRQVAHPFPQISLTVCSIFIIFYKDVYQKPNSQTVVRKNLWLQLSFTLLVLDYTQALIHLSWLKIEEKIRDCSGVRCNIKKTCLKDKY